MSVPQRRHKQSTKNAAFALFNQIKKALDLKVQDGNIRGTTRFTVKQSLYSLAYTGFAVFRAAYGAPTKYMIYLSACGCTGIYICLGVFFAQIHFMKISPSFTLW